MEQINGGLLPLPKDKLDYDYERVFGAITTLPIEDFMVGELLEIKNQGTDDTCTARAYNAISELQERVKLSDAYQFMLTKEKDPYSWGANLRDALRAGMCGSLTQEDSPFSINKHGRDFIVKAENWDNTEKGNRFELDMKARKHKGQSYFHIKKGHRDLFDSIRGALYSHKEHHRGILSGCIWCRGWLNNAVINKTGTPMMGHAFAILGQKTINNEIHLVLQLSNGISVGKNGLFYMSREIANKALKFGNFMRIDMPQEQAKKLAWNRKQRLLYLIKKYLKNIIK